MPVKLMVRVSCLKGMEIVEMVLFHFQRVFVLSMEAERIFEVIGKMMEKRWLVEYECKVVVRLVKEHLEVFEKMEMEYFLEGLKRMVVVMLVKKESLKVFECMVVVMLVKKESLEVFECMVVVILVKKCLVVFECMEVVMLEKRFLEVFEYKVLVMMLEKECLVVLEHMEVEKLEKGFLEGGC
ncbi:hypothetical protein KIW84_056789 [Lathyrus oleraceus]|uniref:Uncharacterized protein n=1 Tax=Pisum sativum TaxID=3888 RepID=A0A9D4X0E4_PEA|nr:hypothetical protein KIW84_056789 [Pisum sativum]